MSWKCETCDKDKTGTVYATSSSIRKIVKGKYGDQPIPLEQCKECSEADFKLACSLANLTSLQREHEVEKKRLVDNHLNEFNSFKKQFIKLFGRIYLRIKE